MMISKSTKVLIADDSRVMRLLAIRSLKDAGFTSVFEVSDGAQALEFIETAHSSGAPVGLLLLDVNMPELSGIELVKRLKASQHHQSILTLMISSEGEQDAVDAALQVGVNDYLVKPVSGEDLLKKISELKPR